MLLTLANNLLYTVGSFFTFLRFSIYLPLCVCTLVLLSSANYQVCWLLTSPLVIWNIRHVSALLGFQVVTGILLYSELQKAVWWKNSFERKAINMSGDYFLNSSWISMCFGFHILPNSRHRISQCPRQCTFYIFIFQILHNEWSPYKVPH